MRMLIACVAAVVLVGCGPPPPRQQGQAEVEAQGEMSAAQGVLETMTQKTKMDAYRNTRDKVNAIGEQRNQDFKDAGQ